MASSDIEVASNALQLIGQPAISSFTEGGDSGTVAANLYEDTVRSMLTENRWRFASGQASLSRLTSVPNHNWEYAFQLPSGFLMMYRVYPGADYDIFEDKLFANQATIDAEYVFRASEQYWSPSFTKAVEYKLASEFAISVTDNRSLAETYEYKYEKQMARAMFADSQSRPADSVEAFDYLNVRG